MLLVMAAASGLLVALNGAALQNSSQRLLASHLTLATGAEAIQAGRSAEHGQAAHADRNEPARDKTAWNHGNLKTFLSYGTFTGRATWKYSESIVHNKHCKLYFRNGLWRFLAVANGTPS